jgi:DNA (cytosine-5)-methyltransferase 1
MNAQMALDGDGNDCIAPASPAPTTSTRPRLLDLFCGAGGAAAGYARAGFRIVGVDLEHQPNYPYEFIRCDAIRILSFLADDAEPWPGAPWFDAIHASPPCQDHSTTRDFGGPHGTGWMLPATLHYLAKLRVPWVVENVKTAPLARQRDLFGANGLELCGCMFPELRGLIYEARLFQTSLPVQQPAHRFHQWPQTKMGRPPKDGECMQVTGHFSGVPEAQRRMGIDWMTQGELAQAIAPAYTEFIGRQLLSVLPVT